jgi:replication factor A1
MKISELQPKQGNVNVEGTIKEISPAREFQKFGRPGKVANCVLEDDSGSIILTLWNEDIENVAVGDHIKVVNGYVNEWQGEKQLTSGRYGSLEKVVEVPDEDEDGEED